MKQSTTSINTPAAILWASSFLLAALVIVQAGRLPGNQAHGEMAAESGDYTLVTTRSGRGKDTDPRELLYILDSRGEMLLVYDIEDARKQQILLVDGARLPVLFQQAR